MKFLRLIQLVNIAKKILHEPFIVGCWGENIFAKQDPLCFINEKTLELKMKEVFDREKDAMIEKLDYFGSRIKRRVYFNKIS